MQHWNAGIYFMLERNRPPFAHYFTHDNLTILEL